MNYRNTFIILLVCLVISTVWWIWSDIYIHGGQIREKRKELAKLKKKFQDLYEVQESYDQVKEHYENVLVEFDTLRSEVISNQDDYISLLEQIRQLAQKQNIRILTLSPQRNDSFPAIKSALKFTGKHVERYPVQVRLYGNFLTIGTFLEQLLAMYTTVNIGRISIETEIEAGGVLTCELILYTYMFYETT